MLSINLYMASNRQKDLMREAERERLLAQVSTEPALGRRTGELMLKVGARLMTQRQPEGCVTLETRGQQVITVCPA